MVKQHFSIIIIIFLTTFISTTWKFGRKKNYAEMEFYLFPPHHPPYGGIGPWVTTCLELGKKGLRLLLRNKICHSAIKRHNSLIANSKIFYALCCPRYIPWNGPIYLCTKLEIFLCQRCHPPKFQLKMNKWLQTATVCYILCKHSIGGQLALSGKQGDQSNSKWNIKSRSCPLQKRMTKIAWKCALFVSLGNKQESLGLPAMIW